MTKEIAQQIVKLIEAKMQTTPATDVVAIISELPDLRIEIYPAETNKMKTFYHVEELADICRCFNVSCYVTTDFNCQIIAHIY